MAVSIKSTWRHLNRNATSVHFELKSYIGFGSVAVAFGQKRQKCTFF